MEEAVDDGNCYRGSKPCGQSHFRLQLLQWDIFQGFQLIWNFIPALPVMNETAVAKVNFKRIKEGF